MNIEGLFVGQRAWSVTKGKMGNTTIVTTRVHPVDIVGIDPEKRWVLASWNGNRPEKCYRLRVSGWRKSEPILIESMTGRSRLATREELKAIADGTFTGRHSRDTVRWREEGLSQLAKIDPVNEVLCPYQLPIDIGKSVNEIQKEWNRGNC